MVAAIIEFAHEFCWLLMKLEPAGLKFLKCSDHAEFTRDSFFLL